MESSSMGAILHGEYSGISFVEMPYKSEYSKNVLTPQIRSDIPEKSGICDANRKAGILRMYA